MANPDIQRMHNHFSIEEQRKRYPDAFGDTIKAGSAYEELIADFIKRHPQHDIGLYKTKHEQFNIGESKDGVEIKLDRVSQRTKRLSIEVAEKTRIDGEWRPSGIYRNDNTRFYIQGNLIAAWVFRRSHLQRIDAAMQNHRVFNVKTIESFFLSFREATETCIALCSIEHDAYYDRKCLDFIVEYARECNRLYRLPLEDYFA